MPKIKSSLDLSFAPEAAGQPRTLWLYGELRAAILDGRLSSSTRLPSTRDLARQYRVSRGAVVTTFERLKSEGYLTSRVGAGNFVSDTVRPRKPIAALPAALPNYIGRAAAEYRVPKPFVGLTISRGSRPERLAMPNKSAVANYLSADRPDEYLALPRILRIG
jgi:DNA-binding transcriptional MocR family regulator